MKYLDQSTQRDQRATRFLIYQGLEDYHKHNPDQLEALALLQIVVAKQVPAAANAVANAAVAGHCSSIGEDLSFEEMISVTKLSNVRT